MKIQTKRIYEAASRSDGVRILVDRLWPRGVSKVEARLDLWAKDIGPTTELREWFDHDPKKWRVFRTKYRKELAANQSAVKLLLDTAKGKTLTLLYGAKDTLHNEAVVLAEYLGEV